MAFLYGAVPVDMDAALGQLRAARDLGVLLVRDLGAHDRLSLQVPDDAGLPRVIGSGQHIAVEGGFVEGSHVPVPPERLVEGAMAEMDAGATWVKVITDWQPGDLAYPLPVTEGDGGSGSRARGSGGRPRGANGPGNPGGRRRLDRARLQPRRVEDLREMARRGIAWAPTTNLFVRDLQQVDEMIASAEDPDRRVRLEEWRQGVVGQFEGLALTVPLAAQLGVTLLASTDTCGTVADEVERWIGWGVDPEIALGAASWDARRYLLGDEPAEGDSADVVTFEEDPRLDPSTLRRPVAIVLRGRRTR